MTLENAIRSISVKDQLHKIASKGAATATLIYTYACTFSCIVIFNATAYFDLQRRPWYLHNLCENTTPPRFMDFDVHDYDEYRCSYRSLAIPRYSRRHSRNAKLIITQEVRNLIATWNGTDRVNLINKCITIIISY